MKIALGADHAGFELKEIIRQHLANRGFELDDRGTNSPDSVDYPDFARLVGEQVASGKADLGILVCGAGIGMSIAANKVTGIRAATRTVKSRPSLAVNTTMPTFWRWAEGCSIHNWGSGSWIAGSAPAFILPINQSLTIRQKHRAPRVPELGKLEYLVGK